MTKTGNIILVILLVVIIAVAVVVFRPNNEIGDLVDETDTVNMLVEDNAIAAFAQIPSDSLFADLVVLKNGGYVVVHEDEDGAPGAIIGESGYLSAGEHSDLSVPLSRELEEDESVFAMLHEDTDGDEIFDAEQDAPITGSTGDIIQASLTATSDLGHDSSNGDNMEEDGVTVVRYTSNGFTPSSVTISAGDTIRFVNESDRGMWVGSAMHPTHEVYDGTSLSDHCGDGPSSTSFDQCESGEEYVFTFEKTGSWGYHNHVRASHFGTIVVE